MGYDPNDPGINLSDADFQRVVQAVQRVQAEPLSRDTVPPYITRKHQEYPRVVRGQSTATQSGNVVTMNNVKEVAHGRNPVANDLTATLRIANIYVPESFTSGQWFFAVFSPNVLSADDIRSGGIQVDWEVLPTGSGGNGNFRRFKLLEDKLSVNGTALVRWLDLNDNDIAGTDGQDVVYDPFLMFSGKPDGYLTVGTGISNGFAFEGVALQRTDIGTTGLAPRWEIIDMQGFARWIEATCASSYLGGLSYLFTGVYQTDDRWDTKQPYITGTDVAVDTTHYLVSPIEGDQAFLMLLDADGDEGATGPIYLPIAVKDRTAFVMVNGTTNNDGGVIKQGSVFPGKYGNSIAGASPVSGDVPSTCWITDLRGHTYLPNGQFYSGRFDGLWTNGTDTRPRFIISAQLRAVVGATTAAVQVSDSTFQLTSLSPMFGPTITGTALTVEQTFPVGYAGGELVMAIETENGHWINTPDSGKVRCSSADSYPEYLIDSIDNHSTYNSSTHQLVYAEEVANALVLNNTHIRLFTSNGSSTGTDRYVAAGTDDTSPATLIEKLWSTGTSTGTDTFIKWEKYTDGSVKKVRGFFTPSSGGSLQWGKVTTAASAASAQNSPSVDGRCTLDTAYGGTTGVVLQNRYPDPIPINVEVCIDGGGNVVTWSCGNF